MTSSALMYSLIRKRSKYPNHTVIIVIIIIIIIMIIIIITVHTSRQMWWQLVTLDFQDSLEDLVFPGTTVPSFVFLRYSSGLFGTVSGALITTGTGIRPLSFMQCFFCTRISSNNSRPSINRPPPAPLACNVIQKN